MSCSCMSCRAGLLHLQAERARVEFPGPVNMMVVSAVVEGRSVPTPRLNSVDNSFAASKSGNVLWSNCHPVWPEDAEAWV